MGGERRHNERAEDRKFLSRVKIEFRNGPISFAMNCVQISILVFGIIFAGIKYGVFQPEFSSMKTTVCELVKRVDIHIEADASEHASIKNVISAYTGKPLNLPSEDKIRENK